MRYLIILTVLLTALASCGRDKEKDIIGVVKEAGGCLPDSYFVQIVGGDTRNAPFICTDTPPSSLGMNCSNAVFISLPEAFRVPGKRIRFIYKSSQPTCLSSSYAPRLITVESLRAD